MSRLIYTSSKHHFTFLSFIIGVFLLLSMIACSSDQSNGGKQNAVKQKSNPNLPPAGNKAFSLLDANTTNIDFNNKLTPNMANKYNLIAYTYYYNGGGVVMEDFNQDGLLDVFFTGNQVPNKLFFNEGNFKFKDVSAKSGLSNNKWSTGATVADVNQDGWPDIFVCNAGPIDDNAKIANQLFINNKNGTFTDKAAEYGVAGKEFSTQAVFFDYDKDNDLDLLVMNHSFFWRVPFSKIVDRLRTDRALQEKISPHLYRNDGNGKFTDITVSAGLLNYSYGLGLVASDINNDGWTDFYISNDFDAPDFMYINQKNGTFKEQIKEYTRQISWFGMGCDIADINNDANPDISVMDMTAADHIRSKTLMANMSSETFWNLVEKRKYQYQYMFNSLQVNNGNNSYSNIANLTGMHQTDWSWATLLADYDNDGDKDNFITNGYRKYSLDNDYRAVYNQVMDKYNKKVPIDERNKLYDLIPEIKLPNLLYRNDGDLHFTEIASESGLAQPSYSNGAAYGDLDNDGDLDLVVNNIDANAFVYRNNANGNNYLRIKLEGIQKSDPVFNAKVTLKYEDDQVQFQEFTQTRGYQSAVEPFLHFGLGKTNEVDQVKVVWHTGEEQIISNVKANQVLTIKKESGLPKAAQNKGNETLFAQVKGSLFNHQENEFNDFDREVLLPHKQSRLGPFVSSADVNGDKRPDFYIGGAKGQSGQLFLQQANGSFTTAPSQVWSADKSCEDMGACFFDFEGDGDQDLYVVSGGNEVPAGDALLQDRLYLNDGKGNFKKSNKIAQTRSSGQRVKANDFDGDGDMDLFVGGKGVPGKYPYPDRSYLLINEKGRLIDATNKLAPDLKNVGMVTDFVWTDFNGDKQTDLVVVGEWMPVTFFEGNGNGFKKVEERNDLQGWWYSVAASDLDNDGDEDLVIGNIGLNNKYHPKKEKPLHIYCNDFDENGSFDIVLSKDYKGKLVPARGRQCSSEQMPFITDKCPTYKSFAEASIVDLYGTQKLENGVHYELNETHSMVLWNNGGSFDAQNLPVQAQYAPVNGIVATDINDDGLADLIMAGNMMHAEVETQRYDAGIGCVFINKGNQDFEYIAPKQSGFFAPFDAKDVQAIPTGNSMSILVANNGGSLQMFKLNPNAKGLVGF